MKFIRRNFEIFKKDCQACLQQCIQPDLHASLCSDWPLQVNEFSLYRDDGEDLVVVLVVELHQRRVVEDGEKVGLDCVRVGGLAKDLQEGWVRDKEEPKTRNRILAL